MNNKIRNPFDPSINKCFGCSEANPAGLKLNFEETESEVITQWKPGIVFQGYENVLHGGIIATLLDEVAAWFVYVKLSTAGVTSELRVKYLHPVNLSKGEVKVRASLVSRDDRKALIRCTLADGESRICAEAEAVFFVFPEEVAARRFKYPGVNAFRYREQ